MVTHRTTLRQLGTTGPPVFPLALGCMGMSRTGVLFERRGGARWSAIGQHDLTFPKRGGARGGASLRDGGGRGTSGCSG